MRNDRQGLCVCGIFLFLFCFFQTISESVWAGQSGVRLEVPTAITRGDGFVCRFMPVPGGFGYTLEWMGKKLDVAVPSSRAVQEVLLGVGLGDAVGPAMVRLTYRVGGKRHHLQRYVTVLDRHYPVQRLTLPKGMCVLSKKNLIRYYKEKKIISAVLAHRTFGHFWSLPLVRPVPGAVSSAFGLRRFINGQPRSPHRGIDFRGAMGVPVRACSDGIVDLVADHYFSGRSVYLDHGQGVTSVYFHLSKILIKEGQVVHKGQIIGKMGKTGRATGPHLHFGLYVLGEPINPMPLFNPIKYASHAPLTSVRN